MNKTRIVSQCPVCSGHMSVSELSCEECGAKLVSRFDLCPVCQLPDDMYAFLMTFVKTRGSIKDMEKELGVSYPTVRGRLDELQRLMGFTPGGSVQPAKEVLDMLERGEISAEEAEEMLKQSGGAGTQSEGRE